MARGSYRSIHTVLLDGPDYQALTPHAKLVFLTLKLNLGPSGIDVLYPSVLEPQTGLSARHIGAALDALDAAGWIKRERNLVWIVAGLEHEPSRSMANPNHRKEIGEHLDALPRLAIVKAFRIHYGLMDAPSHAIPDAIPDAMGDAIPKHGRRKTEDGEGNTDYSIAPPKPATRTRTVSRPSTGGTPALALDDTPSIAPPAKAARRKPHDAPTLGDPEATAACKTEWERVQGHVEWPVFRKHIGPLVEPRGTQPAPYDRDVIRLAIQRGAVLEREAGRAQWFTPQQFANGVVRYVQLAHLDADRFADRLGGSSRRNGTHAGAA